MGLLLSVIAALATWIVLISLMVKPFDALLLALLIILIAAGARAFSPFLPGRRRGTSPGDRYIPR